MNHTWGWDKNENTYRRMVNIGTQITGVTGQPTTFKVGDVVYARTSNVGQRRKWIVDKITNAGIKHIGGSFVSVHLADDPDTKQEKVLSHHFCKNPKPCM